MAKVVPLFSSSSGNSFYIQGNDKAILIDAGKNCKQIELAMMTNNLSMNDVGAVFVTHEHTDHCSALKVLLKRYRIPVYATQGTMEGLLRSDRVLYDMDIRTFSYDDEIKINDFTIIPIKTSHDAQQSCGFKIITPDNRTLALITDTGIFKEDARQKAKGCDFLIIESNHDVDLLKSGPYPYILKKRILSASGHLSNEDCARELPKFVESGVRHILLAHLSQENNKPEIAFSVSQNELAQAGYVRDVDYILDVAPVSTRGISYNF